MIPQSFQKPKNSTLGKEIRIWREGCRDWKWWWLFKPLKICRNLGWSHNLPVEWGLQAQRGYCCCQGGIESSLLRVTTWSYRALSWSSPSIEFEPKTFFSVAGSLPYQVYASIFTLDCFIFLVLPCSVLVWISLSFPLHLAQNSSFKVQFKSKFILYFPPKQPR